MTEVRTMNDDIKVKKYWREIIKAILEKGEIVNDRRTRECIELTNQTYVIHPEQFESIKEPIQFLSNFTDWIYPDIDEIKQIIMEKNQSPHYEYSYANRVFSYNNNINQIDEYIIPLLTKSPTTRRAIAGFLNPISDENVDSAEKPSIVSLHFIYRNKKLHLTAHIRSCDMFFGFSANIVQLHTMLSYVSDKTHLSIGSITIFCTSAHIFSDQKPYINKLLNEK